MLITIPTSPGQFKPTSCALLSCLTPALLPTLCLQIENLVDVLLQLADALEGDPEADVRDFTADATAQLAALAAEAAAEREDAASMQQHEAEEASEDGGAAEAGELQLTS